MDQSKIALVLTSGLLLTACVEKVTPEWEAYFSTVENNNNIEWLKRTELDLYGDIVIAGSSVVAGPDRNEDTLLIKYDASGNLLWWKKSDASTIEGGESNETFTDLVVDGADIYVVGQRSRSANEGGAAFSSFAARYDQDGRQVWETTLSNQSDAWDLEVQNGKLYVSGYQTQVLSLQGDIELTLPSAAHGENAWDVEVDSLGSIYVGSRYGVTKYNASGEVLWQKHVSASVAQDRYFDVNLELNAQGQVAFIASQQNNRQASVMVLSETGSLVWQTTLSKTEGLALQGRPQIVATGSSWLMAISDQDTRKVVKLSSTGRQLWQFSDNTGPINELAVLENGRTVMTGAGKSAVLDASGTQIAEHVQSAAQAFTGSLAVSGNEVFIANTRSVSGKGMMGYVAKFADQ